MKPTRSRFWLILLVVVVVLGIAGVTVTAAVGTSPMVAARVLARYPWTLLAEEANKMDDCGRCHEPAAMHTCDTCHDDHGALEMANLPFNNLLELTGDVPEPGYIAINDILPYRDQPGTHVTVLDFLAAHGVVDLESVSFASTDGGLVTIERPNLTPEAMLMPHIDGVRFAAENLHISTWLKGITQIIVVGAERPLTVDGEPTSIGRLLLGPTASVTVEQTDVLLKSETDGEVRRGKTSYRMEGALVEGMVAPGFRSLHIRDEAGHEQTLTAEEAHNAVLLLLRGKVTLILPERTRGEWIAGVVEIRSER